MQKKVFPYIPHTEEDVKRMCGAIGVESVDSLVRSVLPESVRTKKALKLPSGLSEQETITRLSTLSGRNKIVKSSFLGAGAYAHYSPAAVDALISRQEFFTAYTPYQPEASQGTLQAVFEYQTLITQLTATDVANASLYDGASAAAEAALMARRITGRNKVALSYSLHPEYRETIATYMKGADVTPITLPCCDKSGVTELSSIDKCIDEDTACLIVQSPNFFGSIEDIKAISEFTHKKGVLLVAVVAEALSLAMLKPPGELGADIVVGEAQSFGNALSYGGPYLGFMGTKEEFIRQMPGRIVGETVDKNGSRAFCLTFATREQHIRREKATSNICTNQGLAALACSIYLSLLGKSGLRELAATNIERSEYLKKKLSSIKGITLAYSSPTFNEFVISVKGNADSFVKAMLKQDIMPGLALKRFYPELKSHVLVTATEMNSSESIDEYAKAAKAYFK